MLTLKKRNEKNTKSINSCANELRTDIQKPSPPRFGNVYLLPNRNSFLELCAQQQAGTREKKR